MNRPFLYSSLNAIALAVLIFCTSCSSGNNASNLDSPTTIETNDNSEAESSIVNSEPEEESSYQLPKDCFLNPFLNCQGASLGNFLNAYYLVGDFDTFFAFINNSSKKEFGYERLKSWFNRISFGYEIHAINIVDRKEDFGVLVYQTNINNTRGRLKLPFIIENDSAKLLLTNIDYGIEDQYYDALPSEIEIFKKVLKKLLPLEDVDIHQTDRQLRIHTSLLTLFKKGKYTLDASGEATLNSIIQALRDLVLEKVKIDCIGYADPDVYLENEKSDIRNNLDLSVMRASTVAQYLIKHDVVLDKNCVALGVGDAKERGLDLSDDIKRRVEIIISY